jgi:hypothetical protein
MAGVPKFGNSDGKGKWLNNRTPYPKVLLAPSWEDKWFAIKPIA